MVLAVLIPAVISAQGIISDDIIIPPNYNSFRPPSTVGGSYIDPAFGTKVTRMTHTSDLPEGNLGGYFSNSEICYFNKDGSYFIAVEPIMESGKLQNYTFLYNGITGARIKSLGKGGNIDPYYLRWALADRYKKNGEYVYFDPVYHFYIYINNEIRLYDVRNMDSYVLIRKFTEYGSIGAAGNEGDLSDDGRYWVLDGNNKEMFAYDLIDDIKYPASTFDAGSIGSKGSEVGVDYAAISPLGNYILVAWGTDPGVGRYRGIEVYDKNWNFQRQIYPGIIHWTRGVDVYGNEVVYTVGPVPDPAFTPLEGIKLGDFISINIATGKVRLLKRVDKWAHFSPTACNSVTDPRYIYFAIQGSRSDDPNSLWATFWGEIIEIPTDGSGKVRRLVHHRTRKVKGKSEKYYQPDLVVNRQGTKIIYRSTYNTNFADLYMFDIPPRQGDGQWESDNIPPLAPLELDGSPGAHSIDLTWITPEAAEDGDVPNFYHIHRNGTYVAEVFGNRFTDTGLAESTVYEYQVYSVDNAGNKSIEAATGSFATTGDLTPPEVVSVIVRNQVELEIKFSKPVEQTSAEDVSNYALNNGGQIFSATLVDSMTVDLATSLLVLGLQYDLTIQGIVDQTANRNQLSTVVSSFRLLQDYYEDFESFSMSDWEFQNPARWQKVDNNGNMAIAIITTDFDSPGGKRLGEMALIPASVFLANNFNLSLSAKTTDDLVANRYADFAVVFHYLDDMNYCYLQFQPRGISMNRIVGGTRTDFVLYEEPIELDKFNKYSITVRDNLATVYINGIEYTTFPVPDSIAGQIGFGSYNDSALFDNINIDGNMRGDTVPPQAPDGLKVFAR